MRRRRTAPFHRLHFNLQQELWINICFPETTLTSVPCVQDEVWTDFKVHPDVTFWTKLSLPVPISKNRRLFQSRECEKMCVGGQSGSYNECVCMGTWGSLRFWGSISCSGSRCLTQSRKHSVFPVFLGWDTLSARVKHKAWFEYIKAADWK